MISAEQDSVIKFKPKLISRFESLVFSIGLSFFAYDLLLIKILGSFQLYNSPVEVMPVIFSGLGIGGLVYTLWPNRKTIFRALVLLPVSLIVFYFAFSLSLNSVFISLVASVPPLLFGVIISASFNEIGVVSAYFCELVGAIIGAGAILYFLPIFGCEVLFLIVISCLALTGIIHAPPRGLKFLSALLMLLSLTAAFWQNSTDKMNLFRLAQRITNVRDLASTVGILKYPGAELIKTQWSDLSRVDVIRTPFEPWSMYFYDYEKALKLYPAKSQFYTLYYDNVLFSSLPEEGEADRIYSEHFKSPNIFMMGVAGGYWLNAVSRIPGVKIKGVEINPAVVKLMSGPLLGVSKALYQTANVSEVDARYFVDHTKQTYDVIDMGGVAFSQTMLHSNLHLHSYLFTVEAFTSFLNHLSPNGILFMDVFSIADHLKLTRTVATLRQTLESMGLKAENHLVVLERDHGFKNMGGDNVDYVIAKRESFTSDEVKSYLNVFEKEHFISMPDSRKLLLYAPANIFSEPEFERFKPHDTWVVELQSRLKEVITSQNLSATLRTISGNQNVYIYPSTDEKPYVNIFRPDQRVSLTFLIWVLGLFFSGGAFVAWRGQVNIDVLRRHGAPLSSAFLLGVPYSLQQVFWCNKFALFTGKPLYAFVSGTLGVLFGALIGIVFIEHRRRVTNFLWLASLLASTLILEFGVFRILAEFEIQSNELRAFIAFLMMLPLGAASAILFLSYMGDLKNGFAGGSSIGYGLNSIAILVSMTGGLYVAQTYGFSALLSCIIGSYVILFLIEVIRGQKASAKPTISSL